MRVHIYAHRGDAQEKGREAASPSLFFLLHTFEAFDRYENERVGEEKGSSPS